MPVSVGPPTARPDSEKSTHRHESKPPAPMLTQSEIYTPTPPLKFVANPSEGIAIQSENPATPVGNVADQSKNSSTSTEIMSITAKIMLNLNRFAAKVVKLVCPDVIGDGSSNSNSSGLQIPDQIMCSQQQGDEFVKSMWENINAREGKRVMASRKYHTMSELCDDTIPKLRDGTIPDLRDESMRSLRDDTLALEKHTCDDINPSMHGATVAPLKRVFPRTPAPSPRGVKYLVPKQQDLEPKTLERESETKNDRNPPKKDDRNPPGKVPKSFQKGLVQGWRTRSSPRLFKDSTVLN